jgi:hypothetical protein
MAGTFPPIYRCEEPALIQAIYSMYSIVLLPLRDLVGERATYVLPALENIFSDLTEPQPWDHSGIRDGIGSFVAVRHDYSHPVAVYRLG